MADEPKNVIYMPKLGEAIEYLQAYDKINNCLLPHCEMNIYFEDGKYNGKRWVKLNNPKITITQEGIVPLDQLTFGDFAKDFSYTITEYHPEIKEDLASKLIQIIYLNTFTNFIPGAKHKVLRIKGSAYLYFENDKQGPHIEIRHFDESQVSHHFEHYDKVRQIFKAQLERIGWGCIHTTFKLDQDYSHVHINPFSDLIKRIEGKFDGKTTELTLRHMERYIPLEYEEDINPSDLVLYQTLKESRSLGLLEKALPLFSKAQNTIQTSSTIIYPDREESGEGPLRISLQDGRELELDLSYDEYEFLNSEQGQEAVRSLSEFYKQTKQQYEPLLKIIEETTKGKQEVVALQK